MERKLMGSSLLAISMANNHNTYFNKPSGYTANKINTSSLECLAINSAANPGYLQQNLGWLFIRNKINWSLSHVKGI